MIPTMHGWMVAVLFLVCPPLEASDIPKVFQVTEDDEQIRIVSSALEASIRKRGCVCFIEEIGGLPVRPGESFSAVFIVGFFDSIDEMCGVYDEHTGMNLLEVNEEGWKLIRGGPKRRE